MLPPPGGPPPTLTPTPPPSISSSSSSSLYLSTPSSSPPRKLPPAPSQYHSSNSLRVLKMCNSKTTTRRASHGFATLVQTDARPVLQPKCNGVVAPLETPRPVKKPPPTFRPATPPLPFATPASNKRSKDPNSLTSSSEKPLSPKSFTRGGAAAAAAAAALVIRKKSKNSAVERAADDGNSNHSKAATAHSLFDERSPGSLAAAQRELATIVQAQRKMRIAHYGRAAARAQRKAAAVVPVEAPGTPSSAVSASPITTAQDERRCSFITPNSDPIYVAYHDEEWGVPVHDDKMLFELLVLSGAQVGLDWTTILKKRDGFRAAFCGFDAEAISELSEKEMTSISTKYRIDLGRVRGIVDNSNRVLEVRKKFGSLDKYLWGFVNYKPISTNYKSCRKIPVKTSKSEAISKDMIRRGFRFVGPTIIHSFMQAAGLTNDHLTTCPRHHFCSTTQD